MITKAFRFFMLNIIGRINWTGLKYFLTNREFDLEPDQIKTMANMMLKGNYVGLSYRSTHFTSYCILFIHWKLTGRFVKWSHAWINVDDQQEDPFDLTIWEAVAEGVRKAKFWQVLCVDRGALGKPKFLSDDKWDEVSARLHADLGKAYDCKGDETDQTEANCIEEVVIAMLAADPHCLPGTTALMEKHRVLTPQMLIESGDFDFVEFIP